MRMLLLVLLCRLLLQILHVLIVIVNFLLVRTNSFLGAGGHPSVRTFSRLLHRLLLRLLCCVRVGVFVVLLEPQRPGCSEGASIDGLLPDWLSKSSKKEAHDC